MTTVARKKKITLAVGIAVAVVVFFSLLIDRPPALSIVRGLPAVPTVHIPQLDSKLVHAVVDLIF